MSHNKRSLADRLAENRTKQIVSALELEDLSSLADAEAVQAEALGLYATDLVGYTVIGINPAIGSNLGLSGPVAGGIAQGTLMTGDQIGFSRPPGFLGAQCELVLRLGPVSGSELIPIDSVWTCPVMSVRPAIGLLGRRSSSPPTQFGAVADFGLHVATICAPASVPFDPAMLEMLEVRALIDGYEVARAEPPVPASTVEQAMSWLNAKLRDAGTSLNAGDVIATGSCVPLLQLLPGQELHVDFGAFGSVTCSLS